MKLDEATKNKIDTYFNNIDAEELYQISTKKYNFKPSSSLHEETPNSFEIVKVHKYTTKTDQRYEGITSNNPLAIAA